MSAVKMQERHAQALKIVSKYRLMKEKFAKHYYFLNLVLIF
jgi:hypothetical protein